MANLIRTAKSGNDWTQNELRAYNIQVVEQSLAEFFDLDQLPPVPLAIRPFCETTDRALAPDDDTHKLLHHLDLAQNPKLGQEAAVDIFVARLLETLGYASGRRTGICIRDDENNYVLLVQEDKGYENPEPQLIAEAVAAYQQNNFIFDSVLHIPTFDEITFPGIMLVGTSPTFYKIKVTAELGNAVMSGTFPANVVVYRHTPQLPHSNIEGMKPLENRATILQYYQAFKAFV